MIGRQTIMLEFRARLDSVAELPDWCSWKNVTNGVTASPSVDESHVVEESFDVDGGGALGNLISASWLEYTGEYLIGVFTRVDTGEGPMREITDGILSQFPPKYTWRPDDDTRIEIRADDVAPLAEDALPHGKGKVRSLVRIPWRVWQRNTALTALTS